MLGIHNDEECWTQPSDAFVMMKTLPTFRDCERQHPHVETARARARARLRVRMRVK